MDKKKTLMMVEEFIFFLKMDMFLKKLVLTNLQFKVYFLEILNQPYPEQKKITLIGLLEYLLWRT